jgi:uncharacterized membrane-anchored protein YitT (DUF2179 family)
VFAINLPFYVFGWFRLGRAFTIKKMLEVDVMSTYSEWLPR